MKTIGIKISRHYVTLPFWVNLHNFLTALGNSVIFINPDLYTRKILDRHACNYCCYEEASGAVPDGMDSEVLTYRLRRHPRLNRSAIAERLRREYSQAYQWLSTAPMDTMLFWNGANEIESVVCKALGIKTFFFENGYFPNTLQVDSQGINAHASFSGLNGTGLSTFSYKEAALPNINFTITEVPTVLPFYFLLHLLTDLIKTGELMETVRLAFGYFYYPWKHGLLKACSKESIPHNFRPIIFLPAQVNSDTQIILNSDFENFYKVVGTVLDAVSTTHYKLIIKEHPFETEKVDYSQFRGADVLVVETVDLASILEHADIVITVNSSVGLQALQLYKKVITLGRCFYNNAPGVYPCPDPKQLPETIARCSATPAPKERIDSYISELCRHIFIEGSWKRPSERLIREVSKRILA